MQGRIRAVQALVLAALLAGTAACGSTVQTTASRTAGDGLSSPGDAANPTSDGIQSDSGASSGSPGGAAGQAARSTRTTSVNRAGTGPLSGSTRTALPNQPIKIGLMYSTDTNAALAALGAKTTVPDAQVVQDTMLDYINKHGGIAGHQAQAAYYNVHATDTSSAISQGACTQWTQDDKVFAAIPGASVQDNDLMRTCLSKAGVPGLYPNFYVETGEPEFASSPLWFEPESLSLEAWAKTYATGLAQQGFFKNAKVGLVYDDGPSFTRVVQKTLLPTLKQAGANVVATATESIHSAGDLAPGSSQMGNAVLSFRSAGVTHVLFFEVWQGWFLFARQAQSQGWHPAYGLSSQQAPQIMIETNLLPLEQLPGSTLVGWNPGVDLLPKDMGSWSRLDLCHKIYNDAKVDYSSSATEGHHGVLATCQAMLALYDAGKTIQGALTPQSLARALEGLGDGLQLANEPHGRFGPGRHFGATAWRPGAYDEACTCFHYTGPPTPM